MDTDELIRRLAKLRDLAPSLTELPGRLEVGEVELSEVIYEAINQGLVHLWEATLPSLLLNLKRPKTRAQWEERAARKKSPPPFVVLSSLAAFRLDIVIDMAGERWIKRGTIEKEFDRSTSTIQEAEGAAPFWLAIADHRPGPDSGALTTPWAITDRVPIPRSAPGPGRVLAGRRALPRGVRRMPG